MRLRFCVSAISLRKTVWADKFLICSSSCLPTEALLFSKGTIVDGSFIEAPSLTKNADKKRDPEMHSAKKENNWHFGMKMHIGVDKATGIIHTVITTPANVHDATKADELRRLMTGK